MLTELDDASTVGTNPSSPSFANPSSGASISAEKDRERSISASSDDLLTIGGSSIAHNKPLSPTHAAVAEIKGIQSQSQALIFGALKKELLVRHPALPCMQDFHILVIRSVLVSVQ